MTNHVYQTSAISEFYSAHRRRWVDFYSSERTIFETIAKRGANFADVLDVGSAAGGLGEALMERFGSLQTYTGVDINAEAAEAGQKLTSRIQGKRRFIAADICTCPELVGHKFDLVTALGVADWNVETDAIVSKCWEHVRENGHLVISLRLTTETGMRDPLGSYQYIWFEETTPPADTERAPYSVFNVNEALEWLANQKPRPDHMQIYGYWGTPSRTARTPYDRLMFSVIAMRKPKCGVSAKPTIVEADLPVPISIVSE